MPIPSPLSEWQRAMGAYLLEGGPPPHVVADPYRKRLEMFKANYLQSLMDVLQATFPACMVAMGQSNADMACRAYIALHPPKQPVLAHYGDYFHVFLRHEYPHTNAYPWLAALAELEWVWQQVLYAADAEPLSLKALQGINPDQYDALSFQPHPATRLIKLSVSVWDAYQVLRQAVITSDPYPALPWSNDPQYLLLVRPCSTITVYDLALDQGNVVENILLGWSLSKAVSTVDPGNGGESLSKALAVLLESGALSHVNKPL
ncbi:DNA-binding domain-containing protein [Magnetococcus sp. PR-3]|uniref:DNA-binding domain-containing protein n=1 Tax=Magnetococcus sp. PR-3 TaxID=3120355 RepID=UPI002FCE5D56